MSVLSGWLWLLGAIASEVVATVNLKLSAGFTRLLPSVIVVVGYAASFVLLSQALKTLDLGIAYAVWAGLGTAAVMVVGIVLLGEPLTALKVAGAALVIAGVVLLNLGGAH
ncbi:MAG: multidrug efflux SMR transporter [Pseudonocardia sp.]|nr:multidrug efflux SMR transporter [Pseudonocardia sp.]